MTAFGRSAGALVTGEVFLLGDRPLFQLPPQTNRLTLELIGVIQVRELIFLVPPRHRYLGVKGRADLQTRLFFDPFVGGEQIRSLFKGGRPLTGQLRGQFGLFGGERSRRRGLRIKTLGVYLRGDRRIERGGLI